MNKGIFWVICGYEIINGKLTVDISDYKLLPILIPCDDDGSVIDYTSTLLNSKKGNSITHKDAWNNKIITDKEYAKLLRNYSYNYFPRGRVEIGKRKVTIFLSPYIHHESIINDIIKTFRIDAVSDIKVVADNSSHYACFKM